jgi:flagellar biogenesis protein FliO
MPLSPRHSLHVVVWNGRRLLLGCTDQSIQLLAETPSSPEVPEPVSSTKEGLQ